MKTYQSVKTQQKAGLLESTNSNVTLQFANGETKQFSASTFGRWWKEVPNEEFVVEAAAPAADAAPATEATGETPDAAPAADAAPADAANAPEGSAAPQEGAATGKGKGKGKNKTADGAPAEPKKRGREKVAGDHPLRKIIEDYAVQTQGATIFSGQVTGFRSLKVNDHMYMAFNFNTKGVTLQLRSKAVEGLVEYKKLNHMFDARVTLRDADEATVTLLKKLMDVSKEYQLNKPSRKAAAADAAASSDNATNANS